MQVIQVTDYGSPHAGGFVPMLATAVERVRERGWKPLVTLPARARTRSTEWLPEFEAQHGDYIRLAPRTGRRGQVAWLEELIDAAPGPTILHSHMTAYDLAVAEVARRRAGVKAIWHFHTVLSDDLRAQVRNRIRFYVAGRHVERMLCVGPALAAAIRARGAPRRKVLVLPNGLDTDAFPLLTAAERAAARADLDLPADAPVLLHIGRDWHLKGGDLFLDALAALRERAPIGLMVRGGEEARREVERRGLGDCIHVLPGVADIRGLHAAADVMVAPSRGEGFPFAILEALSGGLAVVATDIPGHSLPGATPAAFRKAPPIATVLANATAELLDRDPDQAGRDSAAAHAWVAAEGSLATWGDRLLEIYEDVASDWLS